MSVIPILGGIAGTVTGALSERYGWNVPNYRDVGAVVQGQDTGVEANAFRRAKELLIEKEGRRNNVYRDNLKILTVGIGHKVLPRDNLRFGDAISDARVDQLFIDDTSQAFAAAVKQAYQLDKANVEMIAQLTMVNFQLGVNWRGGWPNLWSHLKSGNKEAAVRILQRSDWNRQTPTRVADFIRVINNQYA